MVKGLIGKKLNMTQGFDKHGRAVPTTNVLVEPNYVVQIKTEEKDGYKAVQLGSGFARRLNKPLAGHVKKSGLSHSPKVRREFSFDGDIKIGQEVGINDVFSTGILVDVVGVSKGKGFAGVVKRHGFAGGPRTHGQSDRERAPGSIGATTTPGRVYKGTKMAGHMGSDRVKVQGLEILNIDKENNILALAGSVPGPQGGLVVVEESKKRRKKYHTPEQPAVPALGDREEEKKEEPEPESLAKHDQVAEKAEMPDKEELNKDEN